MFGRANGRALGAMEGALVNEAGPQENWARGVINFCYGKQGEVLVGEGARDAKYSIGR